MAQPAKGQEPSMEEILASIRRIIADDDGAKGPPKAAEPVQPPPPPARMAPPPPPAKPVIMPPAAAMQEDEIVEPLPEPEAIAPEPEPLPPLEPASDILDLTEQMAEPPPQADAGFRTIDGASDIVFEDAPPPPPPQPMPVEPPAVWSAPARDRSERTLISAATGAAVDFGLQHARPDRFGAERPHARGSGAGDAAPDAQDLAGRQPAGHGGALGARGDRARFARPPLIISGLTSPASPRERYPRRARLRANQIDTAKSMTAVAMNSGTAPWRSKTNPPVATPRT